MSCFLDLELQMVVLYHMGAEEQTRALWNQDVLVFVVVVFNFKGTEVSYIKLSYQ